MQDDSDLAASLTTSSWSHCMDNSELPSDLSLHQDRVDGGEGGDGAGLPNLYKFKSNIRQRLVRRLSPQSVSADVSFSLQI